MNLEIFILSEVSQIDNQEILYDISYVWNLKRNYTNELAYKTERDSQTQRRNFWLPVYPAIFKMDNQHGPIIQPWNSAQCYVTAWMGGEFEGESYMYMYD